MSTERFGEFVRREREAREIGLREMAKLAKRFDREKVAEGFSGL